MNLLDVKLRGDSLAIYHFVGKQFVLQLVGHRLGNDKSLWNGTRNNHFSDSTAQQQPFVIREHAAYGHRSRLRIDYPTNGLDAPGLVIDSTVIEL